MIDLKAKIQRTIKRHPCGNCKVCCTVLHIDEPDFKKDDFIDCKHLGCKGCQIYNNRPKVCKEYLCWWKIGFTPTRPDVLGGLFSQPISISESGFVVNVNLVEDKPPNAKILAECLEFSKNTFPVKPFLGQRNFNILSNPPEFSSVYHYNFYTKSGLIGYGKVYTNEVEYIALSDEEKIILEAGGLKEMFPNVEPAMLQKLIENLGSDAMEFFAEMARQKLNNSLDR